MNYQAHYDRLIERAKMRIYGRDVYTERHHIIPKCMGGDDSNANLVKLLPEEHLFAHRLLCRMYPENNKLALAVMRCAANHKGREARQLFKMDRTRAALAQRGRTLSDQHKANISAGLLSRTAEDRKRTRKLQSASTIGQPKSEEHRRKIAKSLLGKTHSQEHREKNSAAQKRQIRVPHTQETRAKIAAGNKGRKNSPESIERMRAAYARRKALTS